MNDLKHKWNLFSNDDSSLIGISDPGSILWTSVTHCPSKNNSLKCLHKPEASCQVWFHTKCFCDAVLLQLYPACGENDIKSSLSLF